MKIILSSLYNCSVFLEADSQVKSGYTLSLIEHQVLQKRSLCELVKYKKWERGLKENSVPPHSISNFGYSLVNIIADSQAPFV